MHILCLVYLFLSVTRSFVKNADKKELLYALALWFLLGIVYPTVKPFLPLDLLSGIPAQWAMNMTYASIGYSILGHYLTCYPVSKNWSLLLLGVGAISVFGLTTSVSIKNGSLYENFLEGMSVGIALLAAGLFGLLSIPVLSCVNLALSYCCYCILSKIPFVNRWLV